MNATNENPEQRDKFLDEVNGSYAALRNDPEAWKEEQDERMQTDFRNYIVETRP